MFVINKFLKLLIFIGFVYDNNLFCTINLSSHNESFLELIYPDTMTNDSKLEIINPNQNYDIVSKDKIKNKINIFFWGTIFYLIIMAVFLNDFLKKNLFWKSAPKEKLFCKPLSNKEIINNIKYIFTEFKEKKNNISTFYNNPNIEKIIQYDILCGIKMILLEKEGFFEDEDLDTLLINENFDKIVTNFNKVNEIDLEQIKDYQCFWILLNENPSCFCVSLTNKTIFDGVNITKIDMNKLLNNKFKKFFKEMPLE